MSVLTNTWYCISFYIYKIKAGLGIPPSFGSSYYFTSIPNNSCESNIINYPVTFLKIVDPYDINTTKPIIENYKYVIQHPDDQFGNKIFMYCQNSSINPLNLSDATKTTQVKFKFQGIHLNTNQKFNIIAQDSVMIGTKWEWTSVIIPPVNLYSTTDFQTCGSIPCPKNVEGVFKLTTTPPQQYNQGMIIKKYPSPFYDGDAGYKAYCMSTKNLSMGKYMGPSGHQVNCQPNCVNSYNQECGSNCTKSYY